MTITFKTLTGMIWKVATVKTMKRARMMHDRENIKYGAHLAMLINKGDLQ